MISKNILVTTPQNHHYIYELGAERVSVGRGSDCAIGLSAEEVSRRHAEFVVSEQMVTIRDLGSTNGTFLNDSPVTAEPVVLTTDDNVRVGTYSLRLIDASDSALEGLGWSAEIPLPQVEENAATVIQKLDTIVADQTMLSGESGSSPVLRVIVHESRSRITVSEDDQVSSMTLDNRNYSVGRGADNDIALSDPRASLKHAQLAWRDGSFALVDLSSTNGCRLNGVAVDRPVRLSTGDIVRIGRAVIRFTADRLPKAGSGQVRQPVVVIPGFAGSELWIDETKLWPNLRWLLRASEKSLLQDWTQPLRVGQIVREPAMLPGLARSDSFAWAIKYLTDELGYQPGVDLMEFPYDWRQDNRASARQLLSAIGNWRASRENSTEKVTVIAHSMGGLVARAMLNHADGADACERCIFLGTPHQGSVSALTVVLGDGTSLPQRLASTRVSNVALTFDSFYQLLPSFPVATFEDGNPFSPLTHPEWLEPQFRPGLEAALQFQGELSMHPSDMKTTCIFGYGQKTLDKITVRYEKGKIILKDSFYETHGDGIVTERSAVLGSSEIHPINQQHGTLFSDPDVLRRIRYELMERKRG